MLDDSVIRAAAEIGGTSTIIGALVKFIFNKQDKRITDIENKSHDLEVDALKTKIENEAKFESKISSQQSFRRVHENLDSLRKEMMEGLDDIRNDIKTLIGKVGSK